MTKPAGTTGLKDNSRKLHTNREEWMKGKKLGRRKQAWIWYISPVTMGSITVPGIGYWEKI